MEVDLFILTDGTLRFLYYDALKPLLNGEVVFKRASHVDPEVTPDGPRWFADLAPSNGPKLGPFETRDAALDAEVEWLVANHLHKISTIPKAQAENKEKII